jgi:hypothetical protein
MNYIVGVNIFVEKNGNKSTVTTSYHAVKANNADDAKLKTIQWFCDGNRDSVMVSEDGEVIYIDKYRGLVYESKKAIIVSPADMFNFLAVTSGLTESLVISSERH